MSDRDCRLPQSVFRCVRATLCCVALGLPPLIPVTAAAETLPVPVRFVAYNLQNYLPMKRQVDGRMVEAAPKPEAEKRIIVASIAELRADFLGLSEIGDLSQIEDLRSRLLAEGLEYPHYEWVDAADQERHLALLSRFPIVERNSVRDLTYRIGELELAVQRGFLDVTIQVNDGYRLRCVGVHLKSKRDVPEGDQALMRRNEADLLRLHVDRILTSEPKANLLVYGDFNDTRNEAPMKAVQGRRGSPNYLETIYLKDQDGMSWTHFWADADLYSRIDYILFSRGLKPELDFAACRILWHKDWQEGSDHRPLLATIKPTER